VKLCSTLSFYRTTPKRSLLLRVAFPTCRCQEATLALSSLLLLLRSLCHILVQRS
jgi:hypothetical protein